ncbi:MAG: hypothetical protein DI598_10505 [Pseudopedobacter saltans]|uniref:Glycosyl transferase family 1 domain-containing protein n=1 Tax=Pseudopedobacter saltans TaxID=151895 RepID=A0A2W5F274_9SPHI|nr:MAG: hypothetical protein DI598_10505 [Pseudopedobacter saltans]
MKWMLIQSSTSKYTATLLKELQAQYNFKVVDASEEPKFFTQKDNLLVKVSSKEAAGTLGSWLRNKFRFSPIIKKWGIEKILLDQKAIQVDSPLAQTIIIDNPTFRFGEASNVFIQKHSISFLTYSIKIKEKLEVDFPQKNIVLYNPSIASFFRPINWEESLDIKEKYADGNDYFLVNGLGQDIDRIITILKGFSIFKKWQKSGMKIILLTDNIQPLQEAVSNYKYREDVNIVNQPNDTELADLIGASYCTIHLPEEDSDNLFALQSAQYNVPILLQKDSTVYTWFNENAFALTHFESEQLGQAFITMYKAENVRAKFIDYLTSNVIESPNDHSLSTWFL